ncbi:MAG: carbon-nitrogen hydrolase family protein [Epsilonproteobacteria bacterium]|nr:carbon-nitrogen hydrolase family protein [Campylobacterota bacterium]
MKIAALQLSTLPLSNSKLDDYFKQCHEQGVEIAVLGEYVLNSFFKELVSMPKAMIKEQSKHKIEALEQFACTYNLIIVAPIILVEEDKSFKYLGKFSKEGSEFVKQEFLIDFEHWDEARYFDNEAHHVMKPMIFEHKGCMIGAINGFEMHFDPIWQAFGSANVDIVLLPSVSTFGSNQRWNEVLKTRAFLNNIYIMRVNRVGKYDDNEGSLWKFYGNTYLVNPDGQIENTLGEKEDFMVIDLHKKDINEAKKSWGFHSQLHDRGLL